MKTPLPTTIAGWVVFYLFSLGIAVLATYVLTREDIPPVIANIVVAIVSGFLGFLTGQAERKPTNSSEGE